MSASDYIISYTDPANGSFVIKPTTANGTILPVVDTLHPKAVSASTSLTLFGKNAPDYGDYLQENMVHLLENFAGATPPTSAIEGQLWYAVYRYWFNEQTNEWFLWDSKTDSWANIPADSIKTVQSQTAVGQYWYDASADSLHRCYKLPDSAQTFFYQCIFKRQQHVPVTPTGGVGDYPERILRMYTGSNWVNVNSVHSSQYAPQDPEAGQIWIDTTNPDAPSVKVFATANGGAFVDVLSTTIRNYGKQYIAAADVTFTGAGRIRAEYVNRTPEPTEVANIAFVTSAVESSVSQSLQALYTDGLRYDLHTNGHRIRNLPTPSFRDEAVSQGYVIDNFVRLNGTALSSIGPIAAHGDGTTTSTAISVVGGNINVNGNRLLNVADPVDAADPVNLQYLNATIADLASTLQLTTADVLNTSSVTGASTADVLDTLDGRVSALRADYESTKQAQQSTLDIITTDTLPTVESRLTALETSGVGSSGLTVAGGTLNANAFISAPTAPSASAHLANKGYVDGAIANVAQTQVVQLDIVGGAVKLKRADGSYVPTSGSGNLATTSYVDSAISGVSDGLISVGTYNASTSQLVLARNAATPVVIGDIASASATSAEDITSGSFNTSTGVLTLVKRNQPNVEIPGIPASANVMQVQLKACGALSPVAANQTVQGAIDAVDQLIYKGSTTKRTVVAVPNMIVSSIVGNSITVSGDVRASVAVGSVLSVSGQACTVVDVTYAQNATTIQLDTVAGVSVGAPVSIQTLIVPPYVVGRHNLDVYVGGSRVAVDVRGGVSVHTNNTSPTAPTGYLAAADVGAYVMILVGGNKTAGSATGLVTNQAGYQRVLFTTPTSSAAVLGLSGSHSANISVDGVEYSLSVNGGTVTTIGELLTYINGVLNGAGTAAVINGAIKIVSATSGISSTVSITDVDLFSSLTDFSSIEAAVSGTTSLYSAVIEVDGTNHFVSVVGNNAQSYGALIQELNQDLLGYATASLVSGNIVIRSNTIGAGSSIAVISSQLFSSLSGYQSIDASVTGQHAYEATVTFDGVVKTVSVSSSNAPNMSALVSVLNSQFGQAGYATYDWTTGDLNILSNSPTGVVTITEPVTGGGAFSSLANYSATNPVYAYVGGVKEVGAGLSKSNKITFVSPLTAAQLVEVVVNADITKA